MVQKVNYVTWILSQYKNQSTFIPSGQGQSISFQNGNNHFSVELPFFRNLCRLSTLKWKSETPNVLKFETLKLWVLTLHHKWKLHTWPHLMCHSQNAGILLICSVFKVYMKNKWIWYLDLDPIPKISHCNMKTRICKYSKQNKKNLNNLKSETLLVPGISDKGHSTCIIKLFNIALSYMEIIRSWMVWLIAWTIYEKWGPGTVLKIPLLASPGIKKIPLKKIKYQ